MRCLFAVVRLFKMIRYVFVLCGCFVLFVCLLWLFELCVVVVRLFVEVFVVVCCWCRCCCVRCAVVVVCRLLCLCC